MSPREHVPTLLLCVLIILQPIAGFFLEPFSIYSAYVRALIFTHLTVPALPVDPPLSLLMGPGLGLLIIISGIIGLFQWIRSHKTYLLRALVIFSFIWIMLRIGLYLLLLFTADERLPLFVGIIGLIGWGFWLVKSGNRLFQSGKSLD